MSGHNSRERFSAWFRRNSHDDDRGYHTESSKTTKKALCTNEKSLESIWPRIRVKLWRFFDQREKLVVRQVNRTFKREIEVLGGLHTVVSGEDENFKFLYNVTSTRCRILDVPDSFFKIAENAIPASSMPKSPFRCPLYVEKVDVIGSMSYLITREMLVPMAINLRYIEFRQDSLVARYINPNPAEELVACEFPKLISLIFHYGTSHDGTDENLRFFNANMIYLFEKINAPNLEVLNIHPVHSVLAAFVVTKTQNPPAHKYLRWESQSLKLFIQRHKTSLRRLNITLYRNILSLEAQYFSAPKGLIEYSCQIPRLRPELYDSGNPNHKLFPNYWARILRKCINLVNFAAQVENWGRLHRFRADLQIVINNNYTTLRSIFINSYHAYHVGLSEHHLTLDMSMFSACKSLKSLHIRLTSFLKYDKTGKPENQRYIGTGLGKLPPTIESLQFKNILCTSIELAYITTMTDLTSLQLLHCGRRGYHGITYDIAKELLGMEGLHYIKIYDFNDEGNLFRLMALIKKYNHGLYEEHIELHFPAKQIPFFSKLPCCCCMKSPGTET